MSFVVPAWNEETLLPRCLAAIHAAAQTENLPYELVVADDASTDRTAEVARAHHAGLVRCDHRQIAATRNSGARVCDGDVLIFIDADTFVTPEALGATVRAVEAGATFGGADLTWDGEIPLWPRVMLRSVLRIYPILKLASGAFFFCTRDAFEQVGGFDESVFATEEYELAKRLRRVGRYAWIRERVVTSGRRLRAYSMRELLGESARMALGGKKATRSRERSRLWYQERREDPE